MTALSSPFIEALNRANYLPDIPLGSVVATCRLVACVRTEEMCAIGEREREFGDYSAGRFAWFLEDVRHFDEPIPAKGALGLWEWRLDYFEGDPGIPGEPCICGLESSSVCPKHGPVRRAAR